VSRKLDVDDVRWGARSVVCVRGSDTARSNPVRQRNAIGL